MLTEQNFKCKICKNPLEEGRKTHLDHCKETKKIRGILCRYCNLGIGHLKHDINILKSAIKYLSY